MANSIAVNLSFFKITSATSLTASVPFIPMAIAISAFFNVDGYFQ